MSASLGLMWVWKRGSTAGAVEETVSLLDGMIDLVCAGVVVHLPETKAHKGHVVAAAELDGRGGHCDWE